MFHIKSGAYPSWAYLFFLEGGLTVVWSFVLFALLPFGVNSAWFLTEEEKATACARLEQDSVTTLEGGFSWREALGEFRTAHGYIRVLLGFTSGVITTSNANFLAMIVKRLQFSVIKTNLVCTQMADLPHHERFKRLTIQYTVAPALTGAVLLICWCRSSDHFRERGGHITASTAVSLTGYIILLTINTSNTAVLYFAMFLCTIGVSFARKRQERSKHELTVHRRTQPISLDLHGPW